MAEEHQNLNPSNARIKIDYENPEKPVEMEYVVKRNTFSVVFGTLMLPWMKYNIYAGSIIGFTYILFNINNQKEVVPFISNSTLISISCLFGYLIYLFGGLMIISLIIVNNKRLLRKMPDISYKLSTKRPYVADFLPKDVKDNKAEIPLFENVGLDYTATKQFSKYLTRVIIKEHEFNRLLKNGKKKPNEYLWKATFYFKEAPKTGMLRVSFK